MKKVAILFTGGKDSSLVACLEAARGNEVHLLTCSSGIGIKSELSQFRVNELVERFPEANITRTILSTSGLLRKIGIKDIETDIKRWGVNMVLLGDKMAIHSAATVYCLQHEIEALYDGVVKYQNDLVEQKPVAMNLFKKFEKQYGINYDSPIYNFGTRKQVKYALLDFGISNKSLEGVSIFGDSFSEPEEWMISEYMEEKFHYCTEYIDLMLHGIKGTVS
jgi:predicted subunit of tRNA(5-methylaminomethyl-2-thiouridylate) methyltransferase